MHNTFAGFHHHIQTDVVLWKRTCWFDIPQMVQKEEKRIKRLMSDENLTLRVVILSIVF
jgi:hypothetical protein